ncbi:MAG: hypothetical protein ACOYWZ_14255 [Bacillota bacterium]
MKMRITKEDIAQLTDSQKQRLNEIWLPEKYDVAVASICKNAETEEYDQIEFVIGKIKLFHTHFILHDLKYVRDEESSVESCDDLEEDNPENEDIKESEAAADDEVDEEYEDEEYEEDEEDIDDSADDFDFSYERPTTFTKEDCVPLLSIGQMLEILSKSGSKSFDLYLLADSGEVGCEIGSKSYNLEGFGSDFESKDLCDVLWDCVKKLL